MLTDNQSLPLTVGASAANTHDSHGLVPLVTAIPPIRSRRGPRRSRPGKLHADKGYDFPELRRWLTGRRITPRIARRGLETHQRLGTTRWKVERSIAWLDGYRRLTIRYERHGHLFTGFLTLAAALTCYKHLAKKSPRETRSKQGILPRALRSRLAFGGSYPLIAPESMPRMKWRCRKM